MKFSVSREKVKGNHYWNTSLEKGAYLKRKGYL